MANYKLSHILVTLYNQGKYPNIKGLKSYIFYGISRQFKS